MQSTSDLLAALSMEGITVLLVGDKLKIEPKQLVTAEVKQVLGRHKATIIEALTKGASISLIHTLDPTNGGCFSCAHYDGRGSAWPGVCRYFETINQAAKEIDFNVVDPLAGCKFFMARKDDKLTATAGAITTDDDISFVVVVPGICPLCGGRIDRDGGDCWHKRFYLGTEKAANTPVRETNNEETE